MATVAFDLETQIENMRGLKTDLDEHYWAGAIAVNQRVHYGIGVAIAQLSQRIAALEEVLRYHGAETIRVSRLAADEAHAIERALHGLDGEIVFEAEVPETRLWARIRGVLAAADELLFASARGVAERAHDAHEDRRAVVVPLTRQAH